MRPRRELKTEIWTTLRIITILWRLRLTARLNTTEENTHQTNAFSVQRRIFFLSYGHKKSARCASLCIAHPQKLCRNSKLPSKEGARQSYRVGLDTALLLPPARGTILAIILRKAEKVPYATLPVRSPFYPPDGSPVAANVHPGEGDAHARAGGGNRIQSFAATKFQRCCEQINNLKSPLWLRPGSESEMMSTLVYCFSLFVEQLNNSLFTLRKILIFRLFYWPSSIKSQPS